MIVTSDTHWLHHLIRHDERAAIGAESALRTAARHGAVRRLARGVYVPAAVADGWDADTRFRALVHATALRYPGEMFSHFSAAALWRLPNIERWPDRAEAVIPPSSGGRSRAGLRRHAVGRPLQFDDIDGVSVTGLARTIVDVAGVALFAQAVAFADRALAAKDGFEKGVAASRVEADDLRSELARLDGRSMARRRRVIEFANPASGSAGESLSRVAIRMLGFPDPELQTAFYDDAGLIGYVDFWWPEFGVVGEFDGHGKYQREELRRGRSVAEVVMDEKRREDRLRAQARTVARWEWVDARSLRRLESRLRAAGLPQRRSQW